MSLASFLDDLGKVGIGSVLGSVLTGWWTQIGRSAERLHGLDEQQRVELCRAYATFIATYSTFLNRADLLANALSRSARQDSFMKREPAAAALPTVSSGASENC